jgi:Hydrolase of X-linked nucleoside diphosphate N terminal
MLVDDPKWLSIVRELRAIAQTGLTFTADQVRTTA